MCYPRIIFQKNWGGGGGGGVGGVGGGGGDSTQGN